MLCRGRCGVTGADAADLERLRSHAVHREAIKAVAGVEQSDHPPEAEALHALIAAGSRAVQKQVTATGYAALAAAQTDEDGDIAREATRRARLLSD